MWHAVDCRTDCGTVLSQGVCFKVGMREGAHVRLDLLFAVVWAAK